MRSPFPGMDPYLEHPSRWRDVHLRVIYLAAELLYPQLSSRGYLARAEARVWLEEPDRTVFPDVSVFRRPQPPRSSAAPLEGMVADVPVYLEVLNEEVEEHYLQIFEAGTHKLITGIEVISPSNKTKHVARKLYLKKRKGFRASGVSLVEIDLLRAGKPLVRLPVSATKALARDVTVVNIMRAGSDRYEFYPLNLRQPLPRVTIPLKPGQPDVILDLQAVLDRAYEFAGYEGEIDYRQPPVPPLSPENAAWAEALLMDPLGPSPLG